MATMTSLAPSVLGRRVVEDPRDLWYLLADRVPGLPDSRPTSGPPRIYRGPVYDQGDRPRAVAAALLAALHASPAQIGPSRCPSLELLDTLTRDVEGAIGPSVTLRSGCKALRRLGMIDGYCWSYDATEIARYLETGRGLVLGLDWYEQMHRPDETGLIRSWGRPCGGNAVFAFGYERRTDTVRIQNSRGPAWGGWSTRQGRRDFQGCARLPRSDLAKLLADNGEAVALSKVPAWDGRRGRSCD